MYADVVVLTYQSPETDFYTYEIPKNLEAKIKVGQLVSVPFGKRNPLGLVINTSPEVRSSKFEVRSLTNIVINQPILLPHQIELLKWLASYYHAPMVNCLQTILPKLPNAKRQTTNAEIYSVKRSAFSVQQILIIVPNINRIPETLAKYPNAKNYVVYHNELKDSEKFATWQKIISGNVDYIFGSRLSIFAPAPNLSQITIYDEHDGAYKDERSPYFDTLTIAEKLQELTKCKLQIIDDSPKITTYFNHKENVILGIRRHPETPESDSGQARMTKHSSRSARTVKTEIVSMLSEKAAGNYSPISDILSTYIKLGYQKKKKILLFLNKKSESGHVYCKNCKYSEFANTQPEVCPECQSPDIFFNSLNVKSLSSLVKKLVPGANINIIDQSHLRGELSIPMAHPGGVQNAEIDIATAAVFYKLAPQKYNLVAHIRTDSVLNINDFTSQERLFWQIVDLKKLTRGLLLLQTYNPDHLVIQTAAQNNYQKFFAKHLEERRVLSYPPFSLLVKLSQKGKKEDVLEEKSQKLFQSLVTRDQSLVTVLGPYKSVFTKTNIKYNIILKVKIASYSLAEREKAMRSIGSLLKDIPKDVQITVEPNSLN